MTVALICTGIPIARAWRIASMVRSIEPATARRSSTSLNGGLRVLKERK